MGPGDSCRDQVRQRCLHAALWSGVVAGACGGLGGAGSVSLAVILALVMAATAVFRALACAGTLTRAPSACTHRVGRTLRLFEPRRIAILALHCLYGLLMAFGCLALLDRSLWIAEPATGTRRLRERSLLVVCAGVVNGFYYYFLNFVLDDPQLTFPIVEQRKFIRIKMSVVTTFVKAARDSLFPVFLAAFLYYWKGCYIRSAFLHLMRVELDGKPLDALFSVLSPQSMFELWTNSTVFLWTIYFSTLLFEVYLTENLKFPIEAGETATSLSQELAGDIDVLNELAARDLTRLAYYDVERRRQIFSLSVPGGHPTNWNNVAGESVKLIKTYVKSIESITLDAKYTPTTNQVILAPKPFTSPTLRNLALSPQQSIQTQYVPDEPTKSLRNTIREEFHAFVDNLCKKPGISFFFGDLTDMKIKRIAHRGQTVSKVCQGISHLTATSLEEDLYGVVQDSLSKIIVCLLELKLALDKLTKSGVINKKNLKQDSVSAQMLTELKSAVKRSVYKITISFKDHVYDLDLDKDTQVLLQPFLNLREG